MTIEIKHRFTSAKADGSDSTLIQPSNWNDTHTITLSAGMVMGRDSSGDGPVQEIPLAIDPTHQSMILPSGTTATRPAPPAVGMVRYNTTINKFEGYSTAWTSLGGGCSVGDNAPILPQPGDLWWNSADGQLYVYYDDASSSQWVIANCYVDSSVSTSTPSTPPSGGGIVFSDHRLKQDIRPLNNASERLMALKPVNFAWKQDGTRTDGFIAHETQEVVPEAVTGTKNAVDAEGNSEYQSIDQSKLVPLLTAALQEAIAKINTLEARLNALESA